MSKHRLISHSRTTAILYSKCVCALYQRATPAPLLRMYTRKRSPTPSRRLPLMRPRITSETKESD